GANGYQPLTLFQSIRQTFSSLNTNSPSLSGACSTGQYKHIIVIKNARLAYGFCTHFIYGKILMICQQFEDRVAAFSIGASGVCEQSHTHGPGHWAFGSSSSQTTTHH